MPNYVILDVFFGVRSYSNSISNRLLVQSPKAGRHVAFGEFNLSSHFHLFCMVWYDKPHKYISHATYDEHIFTCATKNINLSEIKISRRMYDHDAMILQNEKFEKSIQTLFPLVQTLTRL